MRTKHKPAKAAGSSGRTEQPHRDHWLRRVFVGWIGFCVVFAVGILATRPWVRLGLRFINVQAVEEFGGLGYAFFDLGESGANLVRTVRLAAEEPAPYRAYLRELATQRRPVPAVAPPRKHVVFIQMESADGLVIGARYKGRPLMPFLETLARNQVYFSNVVDNTAGGRTTDAELLVLTSQEPLRRVPAYVSQPLDRVPSLPRALKAAGYRTWSMHGYDGSFWRRAAAHAALGYDESFFRDDLDAGDRLGWGVSDRSVLHQAAQRIIAAKQPAFAHVILLTNHHPYRHVREHFGRPAAGMVSDYVLSVRYMDECIAGFFAELEQARVLDNCIVAVFGDHDSAITAQLERKLQEVPARVGSDTVPLIVTGLPEAPRRIAAVAGLQDVPVIVLEALGLPVPLTFTGNDLDHTGQTVATMSVAFEDTPQEPGASLRPVDRETLTLLALRHPEKLLAP